MTNDDEALGERTCSKSCVTSEFEVFLKGRGGGKMFPMITPWLFKTPAPLDYLSFKSTFLLSF